MKKFTVRSGSEEFTYLMQLVYAIDEGDKARVEDALYTLDDLGIAWRIQNDVMAWADTYGAGRKDTFRVARELKDLLDDYGYLEY